MQTESRNPRSQNIDRLPTEAILRVMNDEDASVAAAVRRALPQIARAVDVIVERLRRGGRLIYVGAGTSGRLAVLDAAECVPTFSVEPELVQAVLAGGDGAFIHSVEGAEDSREQGRDDILARGLTANDVVVGIAASGRTPYVASALETAKEIGAATIAISCNDPAPILEIADVPVAAVVGPEVLAGSTRLKAGTAQKLILNMLSTATMMKLGKTYGNRMVDVKVTNMKLAGRARGLISDITGVDDATAAYLLSDANNEVKTAIVMQQRGVTAGEARDLLARAGGRLADVIGESEA